jgi:hypothetical protein
MIKMESNMDQKATSREQRVTWGKGIITVSESNIPEKATLGDRE